MDKCQRPLWTFLAVCLAAIVLIGSAFAAGNYTLAPSPGTTSAPVINSPAKDIKANPNYTGHLRIYVTEKVSRWADYSGVKYDNAFLDFAYEINLNLPYQGSLTDTVIWDGSQAWSDLQASNVRIIAVAFNPDGVLSYSDDQNPHTNPFTAYQADATAAADETETWANETAYPGFTHTVFIEEGTRTT